MRTSIKLVASLAGIAVLAFAAFRLPLATSVAALVAWIQAAGAAGVAVFAVAYIAATVGMLPGSALTLGAGFVYGPVWGTLLVSPVSVAAATAAFLIARSGGRSWVSERLGRLPRFDAVDRAVGHEGLKIVLLLRLSPIFPFTVLNYALGLTRVRLRDYVLASWVGMLPGTVLYVYLGSLVTSATEISSGRAGTAGPAGWVYWLGLLATVAVVIVVTRTARTALDRSLATTPHMEAR